MTKQEPSDDAEGHQKKPSAPSFTTAEEMSAYQLHREIEQAMPVQAMSPEERSAWFDATWGALQDQANLLYRDLIPPSEGTARHFATMEEKNRYDEQREIEWARRLAQSREALEFPGDASST